VYENLKYGHASLDEAAAITCASAVSREEVVDRNGIPQVHLVSATQLTVRVGNCLLSTAVTPELALVTPLNQPELTHERPLHLVPCAWWCCHMLYIRWQHHHVPIVATRPLMRPRCAYCGHKVSHATTMCLL
jgi:hypothetical protein